MKVSGIQYIEPSEIYKEPYRSYPILDVRSPAEFAKGHIPKALNIPLFSNEERIIIGSLYKQKGKIAAIEKGLELTGPKLLSLNKQLNQITEQQDSIIVHCWRGGMRSYNMAWLFDLVGKKVFIIQGGYKSYRSLIQESLYNLPLKLLVLGGRTGSAKTEILRKMKLQGVQVLDLEELADHKGSAFGWIHREKEVGTEAFENQLFENLIQFNLEETIWVENESRRIGIAQIPEGIWQQMRNSPLIHLDIGMEFRLDHLVATYFDDNMDDLILSFEKIRKKLGHLKTDQAIQFVKSKNFREAARIALYYYDKTYDYGLTTRIQKQVHVLPIDHFDIQQIVHQILNFAQKLKQ